MCGKWLLVRENAFLKTRVSHDGVARCHSDRSILPRQTMSEERFVSVLTLCVVPFMFLKLSISRNSCFLFLSTSFGESNCCLLDKQLANEYNVCFRETARIPCRFSTFC